jgi:hypothetical protein
MRARLRRSVNRQPLKEAIEVSEFSFSHSVKSRRDGFTHVSKLYRNGALVAEGKAYWCNRTWEEYPFYTSKKDAVNQAIEREIQVLKGFEGIKRLTQAKRQEYINYSSTIQQLRSLL